MKTLKIHVKMGLVFICKNLMFWRESKEGRNKNKINEKKPTWIKPLEVPSLLGMIGIIKFCVIHCFIFVLTCFAGSGCS